MEMSLDNSYTQSELFFSICGENDLSYGVFLMRVFNL